MSTTIYYFTGTGNSLKIAKDLKNEIENTKLVQICKNNMEINKRAVGDKIGFVFPVYFRGLPHMVKSFMEKLEINPNVYIFAVANYGGSAAIAFEQIEKILLDKGAKLSATFGIDMPGNMWFMYYPHPKEDFINRINAQKEKTIDIAKEINKNSVTKMDTLINKVADEKIYSEFQPNKFDEDFWTNPKCNGCGICSRVCPANNINLVEEKPKWQHKCEQCLACIHWCPQSSIQYKNDSLNKERYQNPEIRVEELFQDLR
ncbi:MAG TPA: EFR1 family ferrodoxin [Clostridiaceae bacterium]